jgi:hypothetical protein
VAAKYSPPGLFGDHIRKVPPVPIPNTVVKLSEPMIVPTSAKVGIAEFLKPLLVFGLTRVFSFPSQALFLTQRVDRVSNDFTSFCKASVVTFLALADQRVTGSSTFPWPWLTTKSRSHSSFCNFNPDAPSIPLQNRSKHM